MADRLRGVVVSMRGELDISRHVFRAGPSYVLRDPITFTTHRFDPEDFRVLSAIRGDVTLGEIFDQLMSSGDLSEEDEEGFYEFVLELHQRSLLSLPINDADALYARFEKKRRAEHFGRLLGVFFMRIPLVNPDQFLTRTMPLFRWLFTTPALIAWALLSLAAGSVAIARFGELSSPVLTMLDGNNVYMLLGALIGLKIIHEFGHAYACRAFGGHVPEMGVFLVLFTPLAYVDATDSWSFNKTHRRAIVTLGGVYFESIVGAIALFVWAATEASTLNTLAYQVVVLSTVTTALFNLNPLLRYDAYYLVSDLSGVPNLRARCQAAVSGLLKRTLYGLRESGDGEPIRPSPGLVLFGSAQIAYRAVVMVTIATVLVMKFGGVGFVMAIVLTGLTLGKALLSLVRYLAASEEIAPVRVRAIAVTGTLAAVLIGGVSLIPAPWPVEVRGVVSFDEVETVRAPMRGLLTEMPVEVGDVLSKGEALLALRNADLISERDSLEADRGIAQGRTMLASMSSPGEAAMAGAEERQFEARLAKAAGDVDALQVITPSKGRVLDVLTPSTGVWLEPGDPILIFGGGDPEAVFHVRGFEYESLTLEVGDEVVCRSPAHPDRDIVGVVSYIGRVGTRLVEPRIQRAAPDGLVPLNSATGEAAEPYFEIQLRLNERDAELAGSELHARLPATFRTTAQVIERRVRRFLNRVREDSGR